MKDLSLPFDKDQAEELLKEFGSPLYVYDEDGLRIKAKKINEAFSWANGYRNYFAVKATPTPKIIEILLDEGMGLDCSSLAELEIAKRLKVPGDKIFFSSNNTGAEDFEFAIKLNAIVNIDDLSQVRVFKSIIGDKTYPKIALRYNPGDLKSGNEIIGEPTQAKYGMSTDQLIEAIKILKENIESLGLHVMVASGVSDEEYFADTARVLGIAFNRIKDATDIVPEFINIGGGIGVNYKPDQPEFDIKLASKLIKEQLEKAGIEKVTFYTENGRFVAGPHGYLLTKARYVMDKYKKYVGVDASMHNLMRPGMYGAYHHITVLGKENEEHACEYDVSGSLCENNDKFAIDRRLPKVEEGDILVIHDCGAHGHSMGFNYNGLLRSPEVIISKNHPPILARRAQTVDDYLTTVIF